MQRAQSAACLAHGDPDRHGALGDRLPCFTGAARPSLIYDYYGFPPDIYELRYDAPGDPALASRVASLLHDAGFASTVNPNHGWDHSVFIPLKVMFPAADIPAVAMSLQKSLGPTLHCELGAALQSLRDEGVLIVGVGRSYHNLRDFAAAASASYDFHDWLEGALSGTWQERTQRLARWHEAPGGRASHPREEHLLPLMISSGAGSDLPVRRLWRGSVGQSCLAAWAFD